MSDRRQPTCGCGARAEFEVRRTHDGGGKTLTCGYHLDTTVRNVARDVPSWATNPSTATTVRELT